ncbi:MAG: PCRF domain-containing protein, partial [Patescibacteria group bacterium]
MDKEEIKKEINKLETMMTDPEFWSDKERAQNILRELTELKNKKEGLGKYDKGNAIVTIISGAGGDDAEDFSAMLLNMYMKYADKKNWKISFIHEN